MNYIKELSPDQQSIHVKLSLSLDEIKNIIPIKGKSYRHIVNTNFKYNHEVNSFSSIDMACSGAKNELASSLYFIEPRNKWIGPQYRACRMIPLEEYFYKQHENIRRFNHTNPQTIDTFISPLGVPHVIVDDTMKTSHYYDFKTSSYLKRRKPIYRIHIFSNSCTCPGFYYHGKCKHGKLAKQRRIELRFYFLLILASKFGLTLALQISKQTKLYT